MISQRSRLFQSGISFEWHLIFCFFFIKEKEKNTQALACHWQTSLSTEFNHYALTSFFNWSARF